jgi:hypothetical protein
MKIEPHDEMVNILDLKLGAAKLTGSSPVEVIRGIFYTIVSAL